MKPHVVIVLMFLPSCLPAGNVELGTCLLALTCDQESVSNKPPDEPTITESVGRPGKSGPVGPRGLPGPPGQPGDSCVCVNVENELQNLNNQMREMTEKWNSTNELLKVANKQLRDISPLLPIKDCSEFKSVENGVSLIYCGKPLKFARALCDMTTTPGGWTVIQRRFDGSEDFYRNWDDYKVGFGEPTGEYWIGLDILNKLTNQTKYKLKIDLEDREGNVGHATYTTFIVDSEQANYRLTVDGFQGDIGDSLSYHNGMMFTTKDRDHDNHGSNCAILGHGAWWYDRCAKSNLNGDYNNNVGHWSGASWYNWKGSWKSMKGIKLTIRPSE